MKVRVYVVLVKGEHMHSSADSLQQVTASPEDHVTMKDFSAFLGTRRYSGSKIGS